MAIDGPSFKSKKNKVMRNHHVSSYKLGESKCYFEAIFSAHCLSTQLSIVTFNNCVAKKPTYVSCLARV